MAKRKSFSWFRTLRHRVGDARSDVEAQSAEPIRLVAPGPPPSSQNTTSTDSSEITNSTTATSIPHTLSTSNTSAPSSQLEAIYCVEGIYLLPHIQPDPGLTHRYETLVHGKLIQQLFDSFPSFWMLIEFFTASGKGLNPEYGSPSIIIWYEKGNNKQRAALLRYQRECEWLQGFMTKESVHCHVLPDLPSRSSRSKGRATLQSMQTASCAVIVSSAEDEMGGAALMIAGKRQQTFGGWVRVDGIGTFGLTTRHGFDDANSDPYQSGGVDTLASATDTYSASTDQVASKPSGRHDALSNSVDVAISTPPSRDEISTQTLNSNTEHNPIGVNDSRLTTAYFSKMPNPVDTGSAQLQEDWDWALLEFPGSYELTPKLESLSRISGPRLSRGEYKGLLPPSGSVTIQVEGLELFHGTLYPGKASFRIHQSLHDVRLITLDRALPPGSSGTWVDYDGFVCGVIVAARQNMRWAYMIPIGPVLDDIKNTLSAETVLIPALIDPQTANSSETHNPQHQENETDAQLQTDFPTLLSRRGVPISTNDYVSPPPAQGSTPEEQNLVSVQSSTLKSTAPARSFSKRMLASLRRFRSPYVSTSNNSSTSRVNSLIGGTQSGSDHKSESTEPRVASSLMITAGPLSTSSASRPSFLKTVREKPFLNDTIKCDLFVSYDGTLLGEPRSILIKWNFLSSFRDLEEAAQERLLSGARAPAQELYKRSGRCRLVVDRTRTVQSTGDLEDERQWLETVASMVTSFWSQHPDDIFHLEIHWDFSGLAIKRVDDETYADTIRDVLRTKMTRNWEGKEYISKKDLNFIMSDATVAELITEDESLRAYEHGGREYNPSYDRSEFVERVQLYGCKLLALFVSAKLPLSCLWKIMSDGTEESDLPFDDKSRPDPRLVSEWDHLLSIQGGFLAHVFDDDGGMPKHQELGRHTVVPVCHHKYIGEGSFGIVSEVSIDPAHHAFSKDKTERFALKKFFDQSSRTQGDFQNELRMLGLSAKMPHSHITRHLASWTQEDKFYMLFPLAEQNLRHYITHTKHPSLTKENVLWLLGQLKGLADGVRQIHNLTGLRPDMLDLKPENILVFLDSHHESDDQVTGRTWKIADFGSARIGPILSGSASGDQKQSYFTSNLSHGDATHGASDHELEKKTSPPHGMWSLGCIFLECLLWVIGMPDSNPADFAAQRTKIPHGLANQDSAFWYVGSDGSMCLVPAVVERLKELKAECADRGVFKELVSIVTRLLTIRPAERPDAPKLCNDLDAIILQAKVDLLGNQAFYLQKQYSQKRDVVAAPPTTAGDHDRRSIDEQQITPEPEDRITNNLPPPSSNERSMSNHHGKQIGDLEPFQSFSHRLSGTDSGIGPSPVQTATYYLPDLT